MRKGPRLGAFFRARAADAWADEAVDLEIAHHLEMRVDELVESGMDEASARRVAAEAFGEMDRYREECVALQRREVRKMKWTDRVDGLLRDVVFALRGLRRSPLFALTLLLTLGIGVGANTAIFTVVDAVMVRPLPYADADRLVDVRPNDPESGFQLTHMYKNSALAWQEEADFVEEVGFYERLVQVWQQDEASTRVYVHAMSPELIRMLGVPPLIGRSIDEADAAAGAAPVALLSEERWSSDFGRDPDVLGSTLQLDGLSHTIVGVLPRTFRFPITAQRDVWTALGSDRISGMTERDQLAVVARLPVVTDSLVVREQAEAFQSALVEEGLELSRFASVRLAPIGDWRANRNTARALNVLMGGAFLILLVAGMNAANLLLVRGSARQSEIAVRLALGGGRARVVRQLGIEAALISIAAAVLAVLVCVATLESILAFAPREVTGWAAMPVELTGRVALFTVLLSGVVSLAFGVAPLVGAVRAAAASGMSGRATEGRRTQRWRSMLVVSEVALSVVLLVGAGLFAKSFTTLIRTDPGFEADRVITVRPGLVESRYPEPEDRRAYYDAAIATLAALPGVEGVALSTGAPPQSGILFGDEVVAEGRGAPPEPKELYPFAEVDADFASVYGLRFVAGRPFDANENPDDNSRIIDLEMARWLFGTDAPIGERFKIGDDEEDAWWTVIGVVEDLHLNGFHDAGQEVEWLGPISEDASGTYLTVSVRTAGDPAALVNPIRSALYDLAPGQPIDQISVVADGLVGALERERFLVRLMGAFAVLGLGLASLGTFGVISYVVRRRYREIGVRLALGAGTVDIRRLVLRQGMGLAIGGVLLGLILCVPLSGFLEGLLTDVTAADPLVLALTTFTAFAAALAATAGPARWATKVDPMEVLGAE